jgi:hypothetical protein
MVHIYIYRERERERERGGPQYPPFPAARKKIWKIKEIIGSQVSKRPPSENGP